MILKREDNFSERVNDPRLKEEKRCNGTPIENDSKIARKRKCLSLFFY